MASPQELLWLDKMWEETKKRTLESFTGPLPKPQQQQQEPVGLLERFGRSALESATFGLAPGETPEATNAAETVVNLLGGLVGSAPAVAAAFATGGTAALPLASRLAPGLARLVGPRLAATVAPHLARGLGAGAAFGGAEALAGLAQGEGPSALMDIPKEAALFGGGEALSAALLGPVLSRLRLGRRAAEEVPLLGPGYSGLLPEPRPIYVTPGGTASQNLEDLPRFEQLPLGIPQEAERAVPSGEPQAAEAIRQLGGEQPTGTAPQGVRPRQRPMRLDLFSRAFPALDRFTRQELEEEVRLLASSGGPAKRFEQPFPRALSHATSVAETVLRSLGPEGEELAARIRVWENQRTRRYGAVLADVWSRAKGLGDREWLQVRRLVRGEPAPGASRRVQDVAKLFRDFFLDAGQMAKEGGMKELTRNGVRELQLLANYWPKMYKVRPIEEAIANPKGAPGQRIIGHLIRTNQAADEEEAVQLLQAYLRDERTRQAARNVLTGGLETRAPFQPFQKQRLLDLPEEYELDPATEFLLYARGWSKQMATHEVFGGENLPRLTPLLGEIRNRLSADEAAFAEKIVRRLLGIDSDEGEAWRFVVNSLQNFHVATRLTLSAIPNITQSVSTASITGLRPVVKAIAQAARDWQGSVRFAQHAGAIFDPDELSKTFAELADGGWFHREAQAVLKYSGFNLTEQFNQVVAANAGKLWADDLFDALRGQPASWIAKALRGGRSEESIREVFQNAGVDVARALREGALSDNDRLKVAQYVLRATQFPRSVLDVPLWTTSPQGRLIFQFQRFTTQQTRFIRDHIIKEARRGNLIPLVTLASLGGAAGYGVGLIRDAISRRERPEGLAATYLDALSWVGAYGLFEPVWRAVSQGGDRAFISLFGPTAGLGRDLATAASGVQTALRGDTERGARIAGEALLRGLTPTPIGYPIARGELPVVGPVPALQRVFQPEQYDPTGRLAAMRTYDEATKRIEDAYVRWQATGDREPFARALREASQKGLRLSLQDLNRRVRQPDVQLRVLQERLRRARGPERAALQQQIQVLERLAEQERLRRVPEAAQGLLAQ